MNTLSLLFLKVFLYIFPAGSPSFLKNIPLIGVYFARMSVPKARHPYAEESVPKGRHPYAEEIVIKHTKSSWNLYIPMESRRVEDISIINGNYSVAITRNGQLRTYSVKRQKSSILISCIENGREVFSESYEGVLQVDHYSTRADTLNHEKLGPVVKISFEK